MLDEQPRGRLVRLGLHDDVAGHAVLDVRHALRRDALRLPQRRADVDDGGAVALAESSLAPAQLLRLLKQLERAAGRLRGGIAISVVVVGAILAASASLFTLLKLAGAVYLGGNRFQTLARAGRVSGSAEALRQAIQDTDDSVLKREYL